MRLFVFLVLPFSFFLFPFSFFLFPFSFFHFPFSIFHFPSNGLRVNANRSSHLCQLKTEGPEICDRPRTIRTLYLLRHHTIHPSRIACGSYAQSFAQRRPNGGTCQVSLDRILQPLVGALFCTVTTQSRRDAFRHCSFGKKKVEMSVVGAEPYLLARHFHPENSRRRLAGSRSASL